MWRRLKPTNAPQPSGYGFAIRASYCPLLSRARCKALRINGPTIFEGHIATGQKTRPQSPPTKNSLLAPFEHKAGPGGLLPGEIPGILNICAYIRYLCGAHDLARLVLVRVTSMNQRVVEHDNLDSVSAAGTTDADTPAKRGAGRLHSSRNLGWGRKDLGGSCS